VTKRARYLVVLLTVLSSLSIASYGALLLPILEGADEDAHLDYVWSIARAGSLLRVGERPSASVDPIIRIGDPDIWSLAVRTDLFAVRGDASKRMPPGYG